MKHRLGKIQFQKSVLHRDVLSNSLYLSEIFANFIPISIHENDKVGIIIYLGYSSQFDELDVGSIIPEYDIIIQSEVQEFDKLNSITNHFRGFKRL